MRFDVKPLFLYLAAHAKRLKYVYFGYDYDLFILILQEIQSLEEIHFVSGGMDMEPILAHPFLQDITLTLPTLRSIHVNNGDDAFMEKLLRKCPNLEEFIYSPMQFYTISPTLLTQLYHCLPHLKILQLNCHCKTEIKSFLQTMPIASSLKRVKLECIDDQGWEHITSKCPNILSLHIVDIKLTNQFSGLMQLFETGHQTKYLQSLVLWNANIPDTQYAAFFQHANPTTIPCLRQFYLVFPMGEPEYTYHNDELFVLQSILSSPLHTPLESLQLNGSWTTRCNIDWFTGIAWETIPKWEKMHSLCIGRIPLYQLEELLSKVPNLHTFAFGPILSRDESLRVDHSLISQLPDMIDATTRPANCHLLNQKTFRQVPKLKEFQCYVHNDHTVEDSVWEEIIAACPTLDTLVVKRSDWSGNEEYWRDEDEDHSIFLEKYGKRLDLVGSQLLFGYH